MIIGGGSLCLLFTALLLYACATTKEGPSPVIEDDPFQYLIETVLVPGGSFLMGSPPGTAGSNDRERPVHTVSISSFLMGKYEVTQGQYFTVMGTRPSNTTSNSEDPGEDGWKKLPVEMINWYEALVFCNKLSIDENLSPVYRINGSTNPADWGDIPTNNNNVVWNSAEMIRGAKGYRLPTEAEWEYAARGGENPPEKYTYTGSNTAGSVAWYSENSANKSHEIGQKSPNNLDLYDMSGNVMEWCWDWFGNYTNDSQIDPAGVSKSLYRAIRGGGWSVSVQFSRTTYRHNNTPVYRGVNLGFRVVRLPE